MVEESFVIIVIENIYEYSIAKSDDISYEIGLSRNPCGNPKATIKKKSNIFLLTKGNQNNNIGNTLLTLSLLLFWVLLINKNIFDSSLILFVEFS